MSDRTTNRDSRSRMEFPMIYRTHGIHFQWFGGAYIDVFSDEHPGVAVSCINVWDYKEDIPTIRRDDYAEFVQQCNEWLENSE